MQFILVGQYVLTCPWCKIFLTTSGA